MKKLYACACFLLFLAGCKTEYKDVSFNIEYTRIIGARYETLVPFYIYGVTLDKDYAPNVDIYMITNVKLGGREKITKDILNAGSKMEIQKILSCFKCLVPDVVFDVQVEGLEKEVPVQLWNFSIWHNGKKYKKMNPEFFKKINKEKS